MTQKPQSQERKLNVFEVTELIKNAPIGEYIGAVGAQILAEHACAELVLEEGDFLFRGGEKTTSFYLVISGQLARVRDEQKGSKPRILHTLQKGDLVGELSYIDETNHSRSVIALTPATILQFKKEDIDPLIIEHPKLMFDFMRAIIKRVHHTVNDISKQQMALADYIGSGGKGRM